MYVLLDSNKILVEQVDWGLVDSFVLAIPTGNFVHVLNVVLGLYVRYIRGVQDVVDVLQHLFANKLCVDD